MQDSNTQLPVIPPEESTSLAPLQLISLAVQNGAGVEQLEKLMALQERWEANQARKKFFEALAEFQKKSPVLKKAKIANVTSKTGGSFQYKYADLGSIVAEIKEPLADLGLSYRWEFEQIGDRMKVTCIVSHVAGHSETTSMEGGKDSSGFKNEIQQAGSTHTYLQRYTLIGALGLSTADQDNDGKGSKKPPPPEMTREEMLQQWKTETQSCKNRVALNALYIKNRKAVESDTGIQEIFKQREAELKLSEAKKESLP